MKLYDDQALSPSPSISLSSFTQTPESKSVSVSHHSLSPSLFPLPPSSLSRHSLKAIHFVRLLSFVLTHLDSRDIPVSLLSHELTNLSNIVRHESTN